MPWIREVVLTTVVTCERVVYGVDIIGCAEVREVIRAKMMRIKEAFESYNTTLKGSGSVKTGTFVVDLQHEDLRLREFPFATSLV